MELSKEEKETVKYFYNLRATIDESNILFDEDIKVKCGKDTIKQITILLNLISKLQKENEKQGKVIDEMADLISCECEDNWIVELWNIADDNIKELVKQHFYGKVEKDG